VRLQRAGRLSHPHPPHRLRQRSAAAHPRRNRNRHAGAQQTANGPFYGASRCYYWLHVHAQDGIIHVESPTTANYTLGQFFAIWKQPLTADQVAPAKGALTVFVNGVRYTGSPATIPLRSHEDIQLDVGTPAVAAQRVDWSQSQL